MILTPTTKQVGARYRAIVWLDRVEYHLAGLHDSQVKAMLQAKATVEHFHDLIRDGLKTRSMFTTKPRGGTPK